MTNGYSGSGGYRGSFLPQWPSYREPRTERASSAGGEGGGSRGDGGSGRGGEGGGRSSGGSTGGVSAVSWSVGWSAVVVLGVLCVSWTLRVLWTLWMLDFLLEERAGEARGEGAGPGAVVDDGPRLWSCVDEVIEGSGGGEVGVCDSGSGSCVGSGVVGRRGGVDEVGVAV